MKKQPPQLTLCILLLIILSSTPIHSAAELPAVNIEVCKKLYEATLKGDLEQVQQALADGADINMHAEYEYKKRSYLGLPSATPLCLAASYGHAHIIQFLLDQKASVNTTIDGDAPLIRITRYHGYSHSVVTNIVTILLEHKANINVRNCTLGYTPLLQAICFLKNEHIVRLLILAGANTTLTIDKGHDAGKIAFDMIYTPSIQKTFLEACAVRKQAFQQLDTLEKIVHLKMLHNSHISRDDLIYLIIQYALPYYADQGESQPAYDLLNKCIAEQFTHIKEKLEIIRLLSQPHCLPVQSVATIVIGYVYSKK